MRLHLPDRLRQTTSGCCRHSGYWWSYGDAAGPVGCSRRSCVGSYFSSQIVFVFIYAIVGVGLLILAGFAGQASLGHAAFLAIGAYTAAYCSGSACRFSVYLPGRRSAHRRCRRAGRLSGAAAAAASIWSSPRSPSASSSRRSLARWESVTNGNEGMRVKTDRVVRHARSAATARLLLSLPWRADPRHRAARSTSCARRPAAPSSRSATARPQRGAWASTLASTR